MAENRSKNEYRTAKKKFTTPAFNFDEVSELPQGATLLASDEVNKNMGVYFKSGNSEIWGLQYHPDYEYWQMINLSHARMGKMIAKEYFKDEEIFDKHIDFIKSEVLHVFQMYKGIRIAKVISAVHSGAPVSL